MSKWIIGGVLLATLALGLPVAVEPVSSAAGVPSHDLATYVLFADRGMRAKGLVVEAGDVGVNDGAFVSSRRFEGMGSQVAADEVHLFPGSRCAVKGSISNLPAGVLATPNDLDYGLREVLASTDALPSGRLFTITFQKCQGAPAPAASEFKCVVEDAADPFGNAVEGVTCSVTAP